MHALAGLWQAMWPNMFAPSVFSLLGIGAHYLASRRQAKKDHEDLKAHVTQVTGGNHGDG